MHAHLYLSIVFSIYEIEIDEINKSLKKFLDAFGPKKPASQAARAGSSGFSPNDVTSSGYYYSLLNDVFFNQQYLDGLSISKVGFYQLE